MKIFNTIVVYDFYTIADDAEEALAVAQAAVRAVVSGDVPPAESNALVVTKEREIRAAWINEKPLVTAAVSEADFEQLKGKTTMEIFKMLHTKEGKAK